MASGLSSGGFRQQQLSFCGARLCAKHQPQRWTTQDGPAGAEVLRLVETTQPRSAAKRELLPWAGGDAV